MVYAQDEPATIQDLEGVFGNVVTNILGFAGIVFFILLVVSGFQYMTAGGEPKKAEQARKTLTYAIGGMVLIALALLIIRFIQDFTGINITEFKLVE